MKCIIIASALFAFVAAQGPSGTCGQEDCGAACPDPPFPAYADLVANARFPNPFIFANGTAVKTKAEWTCRRAELNRLIQHYELGMKPPKPAVVTGTVTNTLVTVTAGDGTTSITFTATIQLPRTGSKPFPALIGVGGSSLGANNIPAGIAVITLNNNDLAQQDSAASRGLGKFYTLYGKTADAGAMTAWAWGTSRIIDILSEDPNKLIDVGRLAVTGCSRNGKGALVVGALDERIALVVAQESGSGGAASWRISDYENELYGPNTVQSLHEITGENVWFEDSFKQFDDTATKLPFEHHELHGLVAPRGLLVIENLDYIWLSPMSTYGNALISQQIYKALGVNDSYGFSQVGGHTHCNFPANQVGNLTQYFNRFIFGSTTANTNIMTSSRDYGTNWSWPMWVDWDTPTLA